ncbi:hypothetical protein ACJMK2_023374 [Sinanodonta woodiana]|uniref:Uncharacterized protein n=1 Tax=Sinanodonta woodiana TaxID=1069815 RepID=A0ABD3T4U6_SINWO
MESWTEWNTQDDRDGIIDRMKYSKYTKWNHGPNEIFKMHGIESMTEWNTQIYGIESWTEGNTQNTRDRIIDRMEYSRYTEWNHVPNGILKMFGMESLTEWNTQDVRDGIMDRMEYLKIYVMESWTQWNTQYIFDGIMDRMEYSRCPGWNH